VRHIPNPIVLMVIALFVAAIESFAQPMQLAGVPCATPPLMHCPSSNCPRETILDTGPATELKTGRKFFLDYPCDLKKGEKITFVLSLHGGGSIPNWQRHYFPLLDYTDKYRLVVANRRFAATLIKFPKPQRSGSGAHGRARRRAGFSARPAVVRFLSYLRDGRT